MPRSDWSRTCLSSRAGAGRRPRTATNPNRAMVTRFAGSAGALQAPRCLQGSTPANTPRSKRKSGSTLSELLLGNDLRRLVRLRPRFWFVAHGAVSRRLRLPLSARSGSPVAVAASGVKQPRQSCSRWRPRSCIGGSSDVSASAMTVRHCAAPRTSRRLLSRFGPCKPDDSYGDDAIVGSADGTAAAGLPPPARRRRPMRPCDTPSTGAGGR